MQLTGLPKVTQLVKGSLRLRPNHSGSGVWAFNHFIIVSLYT